MKITHILIEWKPPLPASKTRWDAAEQVSTKICRLPIQVLIPAQIPGGQSHYYIDDDYEDDDGDDNGLNQV